MNTEITFDERNTDQAIAFDGSADQVSEGCQVNLEHNGLKITAKVIKTVDDHPWVGEVISFAETDAAKLGGLEIGSTIHFEERHIFGCAA